MRICARICLLLLFGALLLAPMQSGGAAPAQEGRQQDESPVAGDPEAGKQQAGAPTSDRSQEIIQPLDLGLQEEAGVTLLMLDVKVRDKQGRPVRGLTLDDFEVSIGGRLWPLAAVDDFCNCDASAGVDPRERVRGESTAEHGESSGAATAITTAADAVGTAALAADATAPPPSALSQHFVIYLEFSEFQHTGRVEAERQARRWIEEGMQPGDRVMLAGFSTAAGLVEITPFTTDRATLLQGLEEAFADKAFVDPFPLLFPDRLTDCPLCFKKCMRDFPDAKSCFLQCCLVYAKDEARQGRRALETLELFISSLEGIPGRKQILYFNQNNLIYPQELYLPSRGMLAYSVTDHRKLLESVGATATASRTAINVATMPFLAGLANELGDRVVNLGFNLADFSGGIASRTLHDLPLTLDRAGRECCMYRLSVQVPEDPPRRTLRAKVAVQGRTLNFSYRVRFYTPQERWFRHARLALMTTSRSPAAQVQLALLPVARREGKWSVEAQVSFALQALKLAPRVTDRIGRWRVGALLHREDGEKAWEMLTLAQAALKGKGSTRLQALHSRRIDDLKPGDYRLRAFVEDAELNKFWSREVTVTLPDGGKNAGADSWLSGPVVARRISGRLDLDLAPVTREPPLSSAVGAPAAGLVPMNEADVAAGTILEFRTMLCPGPEGDAAPSMVSILLKDDRPLVRLPPAAVEKAGECVTLTDTVDTAALAPGDYTYRLMLKRGEGEDDEPLMRDVALTIYE